MTVIIPAAGPFIVNLPLLKKVVTKPAITHDRSPDSGCTPEAMAIAIDKGNATRATLSEAITSFLQFSLKPANPSFGMSDLDELYIIPKLKIIMKNVSSEV
tara:strand:+ start:6992 stop:7294 length:303 start_codon:yes stop_codon:yes gene_type:complete